MFSFVNYSYTVNGKEVDVKITPREVLHLQLLNLERLLWAEAQRDDDDISAIDELTAHRDKVQSMITEMDSQ